MTALGRADRVDRRALLPVLVLSFTQDALYALIFLSYMNHYLLSVLHAPAGVPGYTLALYAATNLLFLRPAGWAVDRISPRAVLRAATSVQLVAVMLLLLFQSLAVFLVAVALLGAGAAGTWPLVYEVVARTQPGERLSRATGAVVVVGYSAVAGGFLAGVLLGRFEGHPGAFLLAAGLVLVRLLVQGASAFRGERAAAPASRAAPAIHRRTSRLFAAIIFLDFATISALAGIYGPFTKLALGIGLFRTALMLIPAGVAAAGSLLLSARTSRPGRRFSEMSALYALATVGAIGLAVAPAPWAAALFAIPLAAGAGGIAPVVAATMIDFSGGSGRALAIGTFMAVEELGSVAGPGLAGLVADIASPRGAMGFVGGTFGMLTLLTWYAATRAAPVPASVTQ